ncbi:hypothetical protein H5410_027605 [Solanum commersonii]|uniref:Uncharacterized protein n=1 Tax=Solanum commersonii TaxID=4109 RepID=A0A9J5YZM6_SOLCO|nr:hypothetical protein H5410_027605 [Solanum commersonii]
MSPNILQHSTITKRSKSILSIRHDRDGQFQKKENQEDQRTTLSWFKSFQPNYGSLERVQTLKKLHNISMISILEPFADQLYINSYIIQLSMDQACSNQNGKIWIFWNADIQCQILENEDQHITCELNHVECKEKYMISFIYAKLGSDHSPLLMEIASREGHQTKYFKFLHCWVENENFMHTVKECWEREVQGNPMWKLHQKMKRLASTLSEWSRREFGDIFTAVKEYEE